MLGPKIPFPEDGPTVSTFALIRPNPKSVNPVPTLTLLMSKLSV